LVNLSELAVFLSRSGIEDAAGPWFRVEMSYEKEGRIPLKRNEGIQREVLHFKKKVR
jgi:hypothetical protein